MQAAFLTIAAAGALYFLTSHRRFDVFSLAFVSAGVYFLPGFFGSVRDPASESPVPIESGTYLVMTSVLAAIALGGWWFGHEEHVPAGEVPLTDRQCTFIALFVALLSLAIALYTDGSIYFSSDKQDVLGGMSRWFRLFCQVSALAAVLAFAQRQWLCLVCAGGLLLFDVYVGFRVTSAITLLAIFLVHFHRQGPRRFLRDNRAAAVVAASAAAFFFVYKAIYKIIKQGEFAIVHERLSDPQFYLGTVFDSEPFVTQCILNEVVRSGFETDGEYILTGLATQLMFFGNEFGIEVTSFNDLFQPVLFGDVQFGLAGNVWAEMLAAGDWPLLGCFLLAFVLTLRLLSRWLHAPHAATRACVALSAANMAFYIHRTDVAYQLTLQKRLIACWLVVVFASEALHQLSGRRAGAAPTRRQLAAEDAAEFDAEAAHA